jgi:shikimate kinase
VVTLVSGPVLILVGPPGSGKSTVGRLAAHQLGVEFRDLDHDLETAHGLPAGELVVRLGRDTFQRAEHDLLSLLLTEFTGVLALGGGTPTAPGVPELLAGHHVVFLDADLEHLLRRDDFVALHPWLLPDPRAKVENLLTTRRPIYAQVATATIRTGAKSPAEVLTEILTSLQIRDFT